MSDAATASTGTRLHALDNLRAILMWLGIVLHASAIYAVQPLPNSWRDEQRTVIADLLVTTIHAFRMPAFFILAGFFTAMLAASRGPQGLLRHRLLRLALPFALFWPLLWSSSALAAWLFINRMQHGRWGLDLLGTEVLTSLHRPDTLHLWFLWLLLWFNLATAALLLLPRRWFARPAALLGWLAHRPWGFAVLALALLACTFQYPNMLLGISNHFLPPWNEWAYHALFFAFGFVLQGRQATLFTLLQRHWGRCAAAGLFFFVLTALDVQWHGPLWLMAYAYHCVAWLWSFAAIGLALRMLGSRHALLGYLADSAYWVYLVHYPLTILFGALLFEQALPALLKMAINIAATTLVCLGSYALFVRHGWISQLLNGKRHPWRPREGPREPAPR